MLQHQSQQNASFIPPVLAIINTWLVGLHLSYLFDEEMCKFVKSEIIAHRILHLF